MWVTNTSWNRGSLSSVFGRHWDNGIKTHRGGRPLDGMPCQPKKVNQKGKVEDGFLWKSKISFGERTKRKLDEKMSLGFEEMENENN